MAAEVIQLPKRLAVDEELELRLPAHRPPAKVARVDITERWNQGTRWGDLRASQLASVQQNARRGDVAAWQDLCDFMLDDDLLGSLHQTRVLRVTQSDWIIAPNKYGNPQLAQLAAELCNELMGQIRNWSSAQKKLLHAIAAGFATGQKAWEHDRVKRRYWVKEIEWVHNHRFTYDETWNLRLYDRGRLNSRASSYGRALDPDVWIVHRHQPNAGYPGTAGQLWQCAWVWLFRRWVDKFHVSGVERAGNPSIYAKVPTNTPQPTRDQIQADLESVANGSAGVVNDDVTIEALDAASATRSWEAYTTYMVASKERLVTNYLGASDAVAPGENGSQAAVGSRIGATMDPRMVDDGDSFSSTLQAQLFEGFIRWNLHLLGPGLTIDAVPLPEMRRKTADDEVSRDRSDRVTEIRDEASAEGVSPPGGALGAQQQKPGAGGPDLPGGAVAAETVQDTALNGAQVKSLQEIVASAARGELPRQSALMLVTLAFPTISPQQADQLLGPIGRGFVPPADEPAAFNPFAGKPDAAPKPAEEPAKEPPALTALEADAKAALAMLDEGEREPVAASAGDGDSLRDEAAAALAQLDADALAEDAPSPKALARASTRAAASGRAKRATGSRCPSPLEQALSSGLAASARSRPKR